jgi:ABC-type transport system involved in multi-copper enzyme maturation permease subunit
MQITFLMHDWVVLHFGPIAALLAGLSLGANSVGREYGAGTMHFVLTRPTRRRNFVLSDWTVGLTAMVIIVGGLAFPLLLFLCLIHAKGPGNVLAGLPGLWLLGAAIYGLSYFTTLEAGSAPKGLILSAAAVLSYSFLPTALHEWWHTNTLLRATEWTLQVLKEDAWPLSPFDWSVTAFWLAVTAGFLGASVAWIRFREV